MPLTYVKINSVSVGSGGSATVEFTNIPQTYTDLKIVLSLRSAYNGAAGALNIAFNNETATTNYSGVYIYGSGTGVNVYTFANAGLPRYGGDAPANTATANIFGNSEVYILDYKGTNFKSWSGEVTAENNTTGTSMNLISAMWANTSAITSVSFTQANGSNFVQYSTATLYGIKSS